MSRKQRGLTVLSLPFFCPLCSGEQVMRVVKAGGGYRVRCPHCIDHIPVVHLPFRTDKPKDVT